MSWCTPCCCHQISTTIISLSYLSFWSFGEKGSWDWQASCVKIKRCSVWKLVFYGLWSGVKVNNKYTGLRAQSLYRGQLGISSCRQWCSGIIRCMSKKCVQILGSCDRTELDEPGEFSLCSIFQCSVSFAQINIFRFRWGKEGWPLPGHNLYSSVCERLKQVSRNVLASDRRCFYRWRRLRRNPQETYNFVRHNHRELLWLSSLSGLHRLSKM